MDKNVKRLVDAQLSKKEKIILIKSESPELSYSQIGKMVGSNKQYVGKVIKQCCDKSCKVK